MTISSENRKAGPYLGNDVATVFSFAFKVFVKTDVRVVHTDASSVESDFVLDVDYSVFLNADQDANPGGSITYPLIGTPLATGHKLTILSQVPDEQLTDITNGGGFFPQIIEDALDVVTILVQQLKEIVSRSLTIPVSVSGVSTELATPEANTVIAWDENGTALVGLPITTQIAGVLRSLTTASAGQTVFPLDFTYTPGVNALHVFVNGLKLISGIDYTETSASSVTLLSGLFVGDRVEIITGQLQGNPQGADASLVSYTPNTGLIPTNVSAYLNLNVKGLRKNFGCIADGIADNSVQLANAAASGKTIEVEDGDYLFSIGFTLTDSLDWRGWGDVSRLVYSGADTAITLLQVASAQRKKLLIDGLAFDNQTNTPARFIKNKGFLNTVLSNLRFADCAVDYCIENEYGYGTTIIDTRFADVTGSGILLSDDGAVAQYSYVAAVEHCDLTRLSGGGIASEGGHFRVTDGTVLESIGGNAIETNFGGGSATRQGWAVLLDGLHFESNTGFDIKLNTDGATYWGEAQLNSCKFALSPTIDLGSKSSIIAHNSRGDSGGDPVVVSGSANASAMMLACDLFTQSGTFFWTDIRHGVTGGNSQIDARAALILGTKFLGSKIVVGDPTTVNNTSIQFNQATNLQTLISIEALKAGVGSVALPLAALGGNVLVGSTADTALDKLQVTGSIITTTRFTGKKVAVAQAGTMTCNASLGNSFLLTFTNNAIFTVGPPSNAKTDQRIKLTLKNTVGGAMGAATWDAVFKMSAWTNPANGQSRSIEFEYDGANWIQVNQTGVDVPN